MNINRHNYEEFFLLYVDDELTPSQRSEVEAFLANNLDLQEEMNMLQQVVITGENDEMFIDKQTLYKTENGISLANYEEYFLLHVDNELSEKEKEDVEKFVLTHPPLQDAFTQLRATKLPLDIIEFRKKEVLYRNEKQRRIIPLNWMRMAAAAAVIGLITMLWLLVPNRSTDQPGNENIAAQKTTTLPPIAQQKITGNSPTVEEKVTESISQKKFVPKVTTASIVVKQAPKEANSKIIITPKYFPIENETQVPVEERSSIALLDKPAERTRNSPINQAFVQISPGINKSTMVSSSDERVITIPTVYNEVFEEEEEENRTLYIGGAEINKNKLRSLFKKATSIFDKKNKKTDKENTIQIASFEFKTK